MPTPRPIITPRVVATSGIVITLLNSAMRALPMPMPARATPMGRPIDSTDPKARMRMTMANARPSASEAGGSNSLKSLPPNSMRSPSRVGAMSLMSAPTPVVLGPMSEPSSTRAKAIRPASSPEVAVWPRPAGE